jgi:hypothetical protein
MSWYKLYVVTLNNKKYKKPDDGKILVKFGITHHMDIMKRFDPSVDDGYVKKYDDWIITPKYSQVFESLNEAKLAEEYLLTKMFPPTSHKVWMEDYLKCESRDEYYDNTGITEFRLLTSQELYSTISLLKSTQSKEQQEAKYAKRQQHH